MSRSCARKLQRRREPIDHNPSNNNPGLSGNAVFGMAWREIAELEAPTAMQRLSALPARLELHQPLDLFRDRALDVLVRDFFDGNAVDFDDPREFIASGIRSVNQLAVYAFGALNNASNLQRAIVSGQ